MGEWGVCVLCFWWVCVIYVCGVWGVFCLWCDYVCGVSVWFLFVCAGLVFCVLRLCVWCVWSCVSDVVCLVCVYVGCECAVCECV